MAAAVISMDEDVFLAAARVTTAFLMLMVAVTLWQGVAKMRLALQAKAAKTRFDRYSDPR